MVSWMSLTRTKVLGGICLLALGLLAGTMVITHRTGYGEPLGCGSPSASPTTGPAGEPCPSGSPTAKPSRTY